MTLTQDRVKEFASDPLAFFGALTISHQCGACGARRHPWFAGQAAELSAHWRDAPARDVSRGAVEQAAEVCAHWQARGTRRQWNLTNTHHSMLFNWITRLPCWAFTKRPSSEIQKVFFNGTTWHG